jgi:hypothetical protein
MGSAEASRWRLVQDGVLIGAVAFLLGVVHLTVPAAVRASYAFDHSHLDPVTMFTSAFVHIDWQHLLGNLTGYVAAAALAYGLTLQIGRRDWFRVTFALYLVVLPLVVSLTSYALLAWRYPGIDPITRGFSGVGAGFVGFVYVAFVVGLRRGFGTRAAVFVGLAVWLLLLLEVYVIYAGALTLAVGAAIAVGWGSCLWGLLGEIDLTEVDLASAWPVVGHVVTVVVLLSLFVAVLFPRQVIADGAVTNVFAHATGLLYGMVGASLAYVVLPSAADRRRDDG